MDTDWKIIAYLTDKTVLGTEGICLKEPRRKVRSILINEEGKYALTYEAASRIHTLPGGGIEEGEDPTAALQREVYEETGCSCDMIFPLGIVCENRYHASTAASGTPALRSLASPCLRSSLRVKILFLISSP